MKYLYDKETRTFIPADQRVRNVRFGSAAFHNPALDTPINEFDHGLGKWVHSERERMQEARRQKLIPLHDSTTKNEEGKVVSGKEYLRFCENEYEERRKERFPHEKRKT